jgi:hypothetical protein
VEDPDKVLVPTHNLVLIALRKDKPEDHIPVASFINIPLHLDHGSVIDTPVGCSVTHHPHRLFGSRSEIPNRIENGLVEFVQPFPIQSPVKNLTHVTAVPSEVDIVLIVCHGVLNGHESVVRLRGGREKCTRIMVRRVLAEPRAI